MHALGAPETPNQASSFGTTVPVVSSGAPAKTRGGLAASLPAIGTGLLPLSRQHEIAPLHRPRRSTGRKAKTKTGAAADHPLPPPRSTVHSAVDADPSHHPHHSPAAVAPAASTGRYALLPSIPTAPDATDRLGTVNPGDTAASALTSTPACVHLSAAHPALHTRTHTVEVTAPAAPPGAHHSAPHAGDDVRGSSGGGGGGGDLDESALLTRPSRMWDVKAAPVPLTRSQ